MAIFTESTSEKTARIRRECEKRLDQFIKNREGQYKQAARELSLIDSDKGFCKTIRKEQ